RFSRDWSSDVCSSDLWRASSGHCSERMMPMTTDLQGRALALLNRIAQADWPDRLRLRKSLEVLLLRGSRTGFRLATRRLAGRASRLLLTGPAELFDLSLSDEQQMLTDMLRQFALDELRPAALEAD